MIRRKGSSFIIVDHEGLFSSYDEAEQELIRITKPKRKKKTKKKTNGNINT